jgi:peptide/nickel transport system substrate-binding protein
VRIGALLTLAAAWSGCGGSAPPRAVPRAAIPLPADPMTIDGPELGEYGGRFVIATTSDPRTFNALLSNDQPTSDVTSRLFVGLTEFDNFTQQTVPSLAKSWEHSPDGRTWTFHLRRGACFSDGHPLTAADVLFSFDVVYDDSLHPSVQDLMRVNGRKFELSAPDSYTVVIRTAGSMALFATLVGAVRVMPKHALEAEWRRGAFASAYGVATPPERVVSSGAWRLARFAPGERVVLAPNPYWFGVDRRGRRLPYLDELTFEIVPDQNTAALKFEAGDVDGVDNVRPEDYGIYERRARAGNYTLYDVGPSLISSFFWFNLNRANAGSPGRRPGEAVVGATRYAWFSNPRFRRAVSKAIDRDAIIRGPLFGYGFKNWSTMTSGSREWYTPEIGGDDFDYDPSGAKRLLAELGMRDRDGDGVLEDSAGHPVGFTLKTNGDSQTRIAMSNLIKDDLARVGIRVTPVQVDIKTLITNVRSDFDYEAVLLGLGSSVPSDPAMAGNFYRSSGATHYWTARQKSPATAAEREIDSLFEVNADTLDDAVRHRTWTRIQSLLNQQCFVIWLPSQRVKLPARNGFGNLRPVALPHRLLWNIDRVFVRRAR